MASFWVRSVLCFFVIIVASLTLVIADYTECKDVPYEPVCGSNNRTYPSECFLRVHNKYSNETYIEKESDGPCKENVVVYAENPDYNQPAAEHENIDIASDIGPQEETVPDDPSIVLVVPPSGFGLPNTHPAPPVAPSAFSPVQHVPPHETPMNPPIIPAAPVYHTQTSQSNNPEEVKLPVYY